MRHWAEELAKAYLIERGYALLAENYQERGGEIDLIMQQGEEIVFVEVRQRKSAEYGGAGETIDARKLRRLRRTASLYLLRRFGRDDLPVRFDALLVHGTRPKSIIEHIMGIG